MTSRIPTSGQALQILRDGGVAIQSILDVGVQTRTESLLDVFPDRKHYLFEPVDSFFPRIRRAYRGVDHEIHHIAASDQDGDAWQVCVSSDGSGSITHSHIQLTGEFEDGNVEVVEIRPVPRRTLNSWVEEFRPEPPYLLKVDVDGHDLNVLFGATEVFPRTPVIVVEAPLHALVPRANYLVERGYRLFDIVDLAYYAGSLWQVDLLFIRASVLEEHPDLIKSPAQGVDWSKWEAFTRTLGKAGLK